MLSLPVSFDRLLQVRNIRLGTLNSTLPIGLFEGELVLRQETALGGFLECSTDRAGGLVDVLHV